MKNFFQFITETESAAASQAKKMGLKSVGGGNWADSNGKIVGRTVAGQFKYTGSRPVGQKMEPQDLTPEKKKSKDRGEVTVGFGRFNPPTVGHGKVLDTMSQTAGEKGQYRVYPSRSQDPDKNPLNPKEKSEYMRQMFPKHASAVVDDDNVRTIFDVLKRYGKDDAEERYSRINVVVGSDRVKEFKDLANKYNGQLYNFDKINVISAGERKSDGEGVEAMSASKMRKAAMDNDFNAFKAGVPQDLDPSITKKLWNTLKRSMKPVKTETWRFAPKFDWENLRENYIQENIFKLGQFVENLNTGLVGKIIRRGSNHLICVTEDNIMFKSWIKDLAEYTEVHMKRRMRDKVHPNTLVGTDGYRDNLIDMTPGQYPLINKLRQSLKKS